VGADRTLGDELLVPSVIYSPVLAELLGAVEVHACAHVTGGGIPGNLARVLPEGRGAVIRRGSWEEPRIFAEIAAAGGVSDEEMARVFNLGVGMLVVVAEGDWVHALSQLRVGGLAAWEVGDVVDHPGVEIRS
jgi:phosphoribosylformylglycinamidine cyclo-ligase